MKDDSRRTRLAEDGLPPPEILDAWEVPEPDPRAIDSMFTALAYEPTSEKPMQPATSPHRRPLLASVALGSFVAAGLLLSFWFGRQSVEPRVVEVAVPTIVEGPPAVAAACPEPEPPPPAVECQTPVAVPVGEIVTPVADNVTPKPPRKRTEPPPHSSDLKNPFAPKTATLHIGTHRGVEPAEVYIDGQHHGKTPLANVKVRPGRHTVQWRFADGRIVERSVDVGDGRTESLRVR